MARFKFLNAYLSVTVNVNVIFVCVCVLALQLQLVSCEGEGESEEVKSSPAKGAALRACCEFQSQYNVDEGRCIPVTNASASVVAVNASYPSTLSLPRHLFMSAYPANLTDAINFRIDSGPDVSPPKCSSSQFVLTASLSLSSQNGLQGDGEGQEGLNFTVEGYLKYGKDYFAPDEFCINSLTSATISLVVCEANQNCTGRFFGDGLPSKKPKSVSKICPTTHPCIRRCCEFGEVYDLSGLARTPRERLQCKPSGLNQWSPTIYGADPYTPLNDKEKEEIRPHFVTSHPRDGWCNPEYAVIIPLNNKYMNRKEVIRILKDGTFMRKTQAQTWISMKSEFFCIDGGQNYPGYFDLDAPGFYSGDPLDTIILDCTPGYVDDTGLGSISSLYGSSMMISAVFLLLTVIVYFLLWENQKVHGWTILCYALSLLLSYIFMSVMHFSKQLSLTQGTDGKGSGVFCRLVGICIHFFFVSTFCWLTVINFDLWWTFKVLKPTSQKSKGIKRFICYAIFALGIPAIIVSTALALDFTYRDDIESDIIIPLYGQTRCYMNPGKPMFVYLYGPIGVLLGINLLFFLFTIYSMYRIKQSTKFASASSSKSKSQNQSVKLFLKLFIIMGVSWIFEVISWYVSGFSVAWYWTIFDLFNIFQAILIFIIFVCKKETVSSLEQKYPSFKRFTRRVKVEPTTVDRLANRYPKLKGVLSPFQKARKGTESAENSNASQRTDFTSIESEASAGGSGRQKFELTPKLVHKKQPSTSTSTSTSLPPPNQ